MRTLRKLAVPVVAVAIACATTAPVASARGDADLVVTQLKGVPSVVAAGASMTVGAAVRNVGRGGAKRSRLAYVLSGDRTLDRSDVALAAARPIKALARRRSTRDRRTLAVPAGLAPGAHFVLACADSTRKVRERNERNNCRAAALRLTDAAGPLPGAMPDPGDARGDPVPGPRTVTVGVDDSAAVSESVGAGGGVLQLGYAGTTWTLAIPAGALAETTQISMRPVTSIGGYPFAAGNPLAVQLGPDGLTLDKPAELRMSPAPDIHPARLTTFAWNGGGAEFRLYPTHPDIWRLALEIHHFSGYGAGESTSPERAEQLGRTPSAAPEQLDQRLAVLTSEQRECALAGTSCRNNAEWLAAMRDAFRAAHGPIVTNLRSATTDEATEAAISAALAWQRRVLLYGLIDEDGSGELKPEFDAVEAAIGSATEVSYERAWRRCAHWSTAPDARRRLMSLLRQAQLGRGGVLDDSRLERCLRFRLSFQSEFEESSTDTDSSPRVKSEGTWTMRYSDMLLVQVSDEGKWSNLQAPTNFAVTEEHSETRWCGDPEWKCRTTERKLGSAGDFPPIGAFVYPLEFGVPVIDLLFAPGGDDVDVDVKEIVCGGDGGCVSNSFTSHELAWTRLARGLYQDVLSLFDGTTTHLWLRPPLTPQGADTWTWTRRTVTDKPNTEETEDFVADTTVTLEFAGGE